METDSKSEFIRLDVENVMLPVRHQVIDTINADSLLTGNVEANFIGICELHMNWTRHSLPFPPDIDNQRNWHHHNHHNYQHFNIHIIITF